MNALDSTDTLDGVDLSPFSGDTPMQRAVRRYARATRDELHLRRLRDDHGRSIGYEVLDEHGVAVGKWVTEASGRFVSYVVDDAGNWILRRVVGQVTPRPEPPRFRPRGQPAKVAPARPRTGVGSSRW